MRQWTEADRKAQSERMHSLKPWTRSTGPTSTAGKKRASQNALKHGNRSASMKRIRLLLARQRAILHVCGARWDAAYCARRAQYEQMKNEKFDKRTSMNSDDRIVG